ncbi:hypothetical protein [Chitiniphilus eburneus]|nr:hypothetical protein [Chitiniphilus eburneus]
MLYQEINLNTGAIRDFTYHGRAKLADIEGATITCYQKGTGGDKR